MSSGDIEAQTGGPEIRRREPAFNLPGSLVFVLGLLTLIHLVRTYLLSASADEYVLLTFGFIPGRYTIPWPNRISAGSGARSPIRCCMAAGST